MTRAEIQPAWKCGECGHVHEKERSAHGCCLPLVIEGYFCPTCKAFHEGEDEAADCCTAVEVGDSDTPEHLQRVNPRTLEIHGQQRLLP